MLGRYGIKIGFMVVGLWLFKKLIFVVGRRILSKEEWTEAIIKSKDNARFKREGK